MPRETIHKPPQPDADGKLELRTIVFSKNEVVVKEWGWTQFAFLQNYVQNVCVLKADQVVIERISSAKTKPKQKGTKK